MPLKWCPGHGKYHRSDAFGRNSNAPDGLSTYCKPYAAQIQRAWKKKHAVEVKQRQRRYIAEVKKRNAQAT